MNLPTRSPVPRSAPRGKRFSSSSDSIQDYGKKSELLLESQHLLDAQPLGIARSFNHDLSNAYIRHTVAARPPHRDQRS